MNDFLKFKNIIVILLFLWYSKCFSFVYFPFDDKLYGWISHIIEFSMLGIVLFNFKRLKNKNIHFTLPIILITLIPFCSMFTTGIYNGQPMTDYFIKISWWFVFVVYFILHILKVKLEDFMKIAFLLGAMYVVIKITEQFTYPNILFFDRGFSETTGEMEIRNGLWRIIVGGSSFFYLAFYYKFEKLVGKFSISDLVLITIGLFAIYLDLGRMGITMSAISMVIIYFSHFKSSNYFLYFVFGVIAVFVFLQYYDALFGELSKVTNEQVTDKDYVRWLSYSYYWNESIKNLSVFLFGNGQPVSGDFARNINLLQKGNGLWISDIGIVGELFEFGAVYILAVIYFFWRVLYYSNKCSRKYLFAITVPIFIFSFMNSSFQGGGMVFSWAIITYLIDLELQDDQRRFYLRFERNNEKSLLWKEKKILY